MTTKMEHLSSKNPNPVLSVAKDGTVLYSNEAAKPLLIEWGVAIGEKLPSYIVDLVQRVISLTSPEKLEVKAGNRIYLVVFSPLPEQELVSISGFDVSDHKELGDETKQSEERLKALMDHNPSLIFMKDEFGRYVYLNKSYEKLFVHSKDWYGKTDFDFWPKKSAELFRANDSLVLKSGQTHQFMEDSTDVNGIRYCWFNYKFPFTDSKNQKYVGGIGIDATDRVHAEEALQESEERYRMIFTNMTEGFVLAEVIWDKDCKPYDYRYLEINPAFNVQIGLKREQLLGKSVLELFPNPNFLELEKLGEVALSGKSTHFEVSNRVGDKFFEIYAFSPEKGKIAAIFRDVTARKEAEARLKETLDNLDKLVKERTSELENAYNSLKESERSLAEAQKMAHIGNWEWDIATDKAYWSEEMYRIFKRDPQKMAPSLKEYYSYIHPEDLDNYCKATYNTREVPTSGFDFRIVLANGEERTLHMKSYFIFNEKNTPIRVKGIVQDITESKNAEEEIRYLASIVESSPDAIGTISLDGIITSWNKGAERIYGYSAEEILGKHVSILSPSHLENETMNEIKKLIELIKQGESYQQYETLRLRKDGKEIYVSVIYSPVFDTNGKLTAISIIGRDITERKRAEEKVRESEEKYRNIVETANEGILITNKENIITYVNKKFGDMLIYTPEEIIGLPIWGFISEEFIPIVQMNLKKRRLGEYGSYELKLKRKDGSPLWIILNAKPLFDKDGNYNGSMSMLTDITKRIEAEEALRNFEIARKKEIHHRIKNNLQVISSLLDLQADLFKGRKNIRDSEVLEAFNQSIDRVLSIALIHEELYKGKNIELLNFSQYVKELVNNLLLINIIETDVNLNLDVEESVFLTMDTAIPLGLIINELVTNSFKYAFSGRDKGEIGVILHREEGECRKEGCKSTAYVLSVSDNGIGIPEDLEIENLDSLGMQLVTTLVDQLDGELELKKNNGTKFIIRFSVTEKNHQ